MNEPTPARDRAASWAIALLAFVVYANSLRNGFVLDDPRAIVGNPTVTGALPLVDLLRRDFWGSTIALGTIGTYRPLTSLTFALDWALGGGHPFPFHLTNVLLHALAAGLFHRLMCARLPDPRGALFAAALFALHPLHTENVASIVGRADVLAFILGLLAWSLHGRPARAATAGAPLLFFAALLSKESAVLLVPLFALSDLVSRRAPARALALRYALYAVAVAVVAAARHRVLGSVRGYEIHGLTNPLALAPFAAQKVTALGLFGRAVELLIAPFDLLPDYGAAVVVPSARPDARVALGAAAIVGLAAVAVRAFRRRPERCEAAVWLLLPGVMSVNLVAPSVSAFAERHWYLPSAGAALLAGDALCWLIARGASARVLALAVVPLVAYVPLTVARNAEWATNDALFTAAVGVEPAGAVAQCGLGTERLRQGRIREGLVHCAAACRIAPDFGAAHACRGILLDLMGQTAAAEDAFRTTVGCPDAGVEIRLNYVKFLGRHGRHADALAELARIRRAHGWNAEARRLARIEAAFVPR